MEVVQEKNILSSDSKLESSVNTVIMFWRVRHFRTCPREEMSIIIVTAVHGIRQYRDVCFLNRTRKWERKTCSVYTLIARVQGRIKTYRGGGRKGDGLRCEGGEGVGGQQSTGGRQMSRQNHSTNITTTFLTQHKTKTATTIEISRQHLKISGNKTCER